MKAVVLIGRIFFSLIFIMSAMGHFSAAGIGYAASAGVPMPGLLVPVSGIISVIGGLSIALGYKAKVGAWLIIIFLLPVTIMMHAFWKITDPMMMQMQMAFFMKNLGLMGAALMITYFGSGPLSIEPQPQPKRIFAS